MIYNLKGSEPNSLFRWYDQQQVRVLFQLISNCRCRDQIADGEIKFPIFFLIDLMIKNGKKYPCSSQVGHIFCLQFKQRHAPTQHVHSRAHMHGSRIQGCHLPGRAISLTMITKCLVQSLLFLVVSSLLLLLLELCYSVILPPFQI